MNGTGNLYVTVEVEIPKGLSREQQKKLAEFDDTVLLKNCEQMSRYSGTASAVYGRNVGKQ